MPLYDCVLLQDKASCSYQPNCDGQLMQISVMATPNINKELHYLNKEDRLLRWLLVKQRDTKYEQDFIFGDGKNELLLPNRPRSDDSDDDDSFSIFTTET